jgi:hypothetical protein
MLLVRVELASSVGPHDPNSITYRGWPIKPLPEGVDDEGSGCRVVPASS